MRKIYILFLLLFIGNTFLYSFENAKNKDELISAYIYLLSKNISWSDEKDIKYFKITILKDDDSLYQQFIKMSKNMHLKNKEIKVSSVYSIDEIDYKNTQVVFVGKNFNDELKTVYKKIGSNSILIISENSDSLKDTMINLYEDKKYRINIEINLNNIQTHGLDVNNKILLSGASKVGVGKLYHSSIEAIKKQEEKFQHYHQLNEKLKNDLKNYKSEIDILNQNIAKKVQKYNETILDISNKEAIILKKERLLKNKETKIKAKEAEVKQLQNELLKHKKILNQKIENIKKQKLKLKKYSDILDDKLLEIKKLDFHIKHQEEAILLNKNIREKQKVEIEQQKTSLYLMGIIAILLFLFVVYFYKNKLKYQKINEKLQVAKNEAIFANRSKSIFISKMSHELRTPLNAILGFSDLLLKNNHFKNDDKKALRVIYNSGSFLLTLINDILNISSIESNKIILQENPVDMKNLLNDVISLVQNSIEAKGLKLELIYNNNDINCIKIDDKLVKQILLNLITNSVKYSKNGTITIDIDITTQEVLIEVSDEGLGIDKDELNHIFEPFKQVGEASSATGSGLGLAIVKQFIEKMKGEISVKSELNKGTSFKIKLPHAKCVDNDISKIKSSRSTKHVLGVVKNTKPIKILIVEDKENNILLLKNILTILNFEIKVVNNGEEAIEEFKLFKPDLIFMDKRMPKMDGNIATKIIRSIENGDKVKIVMLSANAFAKNSIDENIIDEFILKPYKAEDIYDVIAKYFDVEYIYEDIDSKLQNRSNTFSHQNFKNYLHQLDDVLLDELFNSAVLLNQDDMSIVMQKIKAQNLELYQILQELIDDINFMEILNTISEIKESNIV
jgi:signal transduction histidine kinase/CheY-like chemotaxis protein